MALKNIFKISILIYINFAVGFNNYSLPTILENNHDFKLLKNIIIKNGGIYKFKGFDNMTVTLDQIREIENEVHNLSSIHQHKLIVRNFFLFTRDYQSGLKYEILDPLNITSIQNSHFAARKTYILVHGFLGDGLEEWIIDLKDKLLSKKDCNVISVDWPAGYRWFLPSYLSAVGKVPYVGNDTALLIEMLMKYKGLLLPDIHSIGHSLGAHIAGFSAKPFLGRVGKISGLDPAGPYFRELNSSKRLDKTDAFYVDVIHTNACNDSLYWMDCFGLNENIGHSDFYPNGGEHQPACLKKQKVVDGLFYLKTLSFPPYGVEDPSCPSNIGLSVAIIIGYLFVVTLVAACFYSTMYVVF
ncbi:Pancreatic triacylglycerol lipase [Armadillidium vulgare]|nr:Pancreatic triacylglycerol lipase [Armadillidium vulgare]